MLEGGKGIMIRKNWVFLYSLNKNPPYLTWVVWDGWFDSWCRWGRCTFTWKSTKSGHCLHQISAKFDVRNHRNLLNYFACEKTLRNPSDRFFFLFWRHPPSMLSTEMHEGEIKYFAGQKGWAPVVFVVVDWKSKNSSYVMDNFQTTRWFQWFHTLTVLISDTQLGACFFLKEIH